MVSNHQEATKFTGVVNLFQCTVLFSFTTKFLFISILKLKQSRMEIVINLLMEFNKNLPRVACLNEFDLYFFFQNVIISGIIRCGNTVQYVYNKAFY